MQSCDVKTSSAIIVIVLPEVLVAHDIQMIVRDVWPEARVLLANTVQEAADTLPQGRIAVAFLKVDAAAIADSTLGRRVVADGGRVVVLGEEKTSRLPLGWKALPFPFASADVASLLGGIS